MIKSLLDTRLAEGENEQNFETWLIISIASTLEWLISALGSSDRCQQNVRCFTV